MFEVYDNFTIDEWKDTYIKPLERKMDAMWNARTSILNKDSWPRRPLRYPQAFLSMYTKTINVFKSVLQINYL
ncbi:hypothetical protein NQ318_004500 [Aromia moschata]|uniref:Uncharacterized protein n=1 Tax=Aromia moschata TaxID=1265417 RepID=A0AAV8X7Y4_9CUCU|nr:hypothetical protein NQ318_004500 [Aromia moschata]